MSTTTKLQLHPNVLKQLERNSIFACTCAMIWNELWYGIHHLPNQQRQANLTSLFKLTCRRWFGDFAL